MSKFAIGVDERRNVRNGRPPTPASSAAKILKRLGPEVEGLCDLALIQARTGDPGAIQACASMLAAALGYVSKA